jgi:Flp pilus assembly protein TadD
LPAINANAKGAPVPQDSIFSPDLAIRWNVSIEARAERCIRRRHLALAFGLSIQQSGETMADTDAVAEFKQGVDFLQGGKPGSAIEYFRNAVEAEQRNPYYLSFLGLAVARAQKKWKPASQLCEAALRFKPDEPQFYLNLAEVYAASDRRKDAIDILESALRRFGSNAQIKRERDGLGKRSGQVLPFLTRQHFLNRTLGQLRHQAVSRLNKTEDV